MSAAKKTVIFFVLSSVTAACTLFLVMREQATDTEVRRKRDADAYTIRNALVVYMQQHGGALPSSLSDLKFDRDGVDPSPFRLLPAGSRIGEMDQDVLVEVEQAGNGKHTIFIYADGTVRWE